MASTILVYGANGYTAELILRLAKAEGVRPIVAGRTESKIKPIAEAQGLECRVFALENPADVDKGLEGIGAVVHCAGPFSHTADAMAEGCIRNGCHYLDITGEISVFEWMAAKDQAAQDAGVMLMPGTGFDVVPSDCLAAHLKRRMPEAQSLTMAFQGVGQPSRGTATTMMEGIGNGGMIRKDGKIIEVPSGWKKETIDCGNGPVECVTIPWGDVSTAYHSTGIPNIMVYMAAPKQLQTMMTVARWFGWLLMSGPVQRMLKKQVQSQPPGPTDHERAAGSSYLWGKVEDGQGNSMESRLKTCEGYTLTALTAWDIAKKAAAGQVPTGFQTPSKAFGPDFVLEFEGSERVDL
jgi:short subunit dehydrogenase-like uncharacterized protein